MDKWFPLETERLFLREFELRDEADVHEYASDAVVTQYVDWEPNAAKATRKKLAQRVSEQRIWSRDEVILAIELRREAKVIGTLRFGLTNRELGLADVGFVLNRSYWNQGYATEATHAVLDKALSGLRLHRIVATCDTRNIASARVLEKVGMRREGHFRKDIFQKGLWRDSYLYAILGEER